MIPSRLRLRAGAVVWQQTMVCGPDMDVVVAASGEVERWGAGLPFETHRLAESVIDDQAFTLIAAPDVGVAWVASTALQPTAVEGRTMLVEPTTAYGVRTRFDWHPSTAWDDDELCVDCIEVDRASQDGDWLLLRRLVEGEPAGPLLCIAAVDVVEQWPACEDGDASEILACTAAATGDDASAIEALLKFLRMAPGDGSAALLVTAMRAGHHDASSDMATADATSSSPSMPLAAWDATQDAPDLPRSTRVTISGSSDVTRAMPRSDAIFAPPGAAHAVALPVDGVSRTAGTTHVMPQRSDEVSELQHTTHVTSPIDPTSRMPEATRAVPHPSAAISDRPGGIHHPLSPPGAISGTPGPTRPPDRIFTTTDVTRAAPQQLDTPSETPQVTRPPLSSSGAVPETASAMPETPSAMQMEPRPSNPASDAPRLSHAVSRPTDGIFARPDATRATPPQLGTTPDAPRSAWLNRPRNQASSHAPPPLGGTSEEPGAKSTGPRSSGLASRMPDAPHATAPQPGGPSETQPTAHGMSPASPLHGIPDSIRATPPQVGTTSDTPRATRTLPLPSRATSGARGATQEEPRPSNRASDTPRVSHTASRLPDEISRTPDTTRATPQVGTLPDTPRSAPLDQPRERASRVSHPAARPLDGASGELGAKHTRPLSSSPGSRMPDAPHATEQRSGEPSETQPPTRETSPTDSMPRTPGAMRRPSSSAARTDAAIATRAMSPSDATSATPDASRATRLPTGAPAVTRASSVVAVPVGASPIPAETGVTARGPGIPGATGAAPQPSGTNQAPGASPDFPEARRVAAADATFATTAPVAIADRDRSASVPRSSTDRAGSIARGVPDDRPSAPGARRNERPARSDDVAAAGSSGPDADLASRATARGLIVVARRSDDPGLPAFPAPNRGIEAPATTDHRSTELPSATRRPAMDPASAVERSVIERSAIERSAIERSATGRSAPRPPQAIAEARLPPLAGQQDAAASGAPREHGRLLPVPSAAVAPDIGHRSPEPPAVPLDSAPIARVIERAEAPFPTPSIRNASREINREIRVGEIHVELGEPLPPRQTVEHAGSLIAAIPHAHFRPRRRL